jgi:hypothetical protein
VTIPDGDALRGLEHEGIGGYPGGQVGGVDVGHRVGQLASHLLQVAGGQGQAYVGLTKPTQDTNRIKLFPPRDSLVGDIPAGDGNVPNLTQGGNTLIIPAQGQFGKMVSDIPAGDGSVANHFLQSKKTNDNKPKL